MVNKDDYLHFEIFRSVTGKWLKHDFFQWKTGMLSVKTFKSAPEIRVRFDTVRDMNLTIIIIFLF